MNSLKLKGAVHTVAPLELEFMKMCLSGELFLDHLCGSSVHTITSQGQGKVVHSLLNEEEI
jgi:hypothetical protein